jgi:AraC family transcriptional regulator
MTLVLLVGSPLNGKRTSEESLAGQHAVLDPTITFDSASLQCAGALPNTLLTSSSSAGWTSVLLDHVRGEGKSAPFETAATSDLTIVVATQGEHLVEVKKGGRWRQAIYQAGAAGLTPSGETTRMRWSARKHSPSFRSAHLYLPRHLIHEAAEHLRRAGRVAPAEPLSSLVFSDPVVAQAVSALLAGLEAGASDLYAQEISYALVTHLLEHHGAWRDLEEVRDIGVIGDRRLARTIAFMSAHLSEPLSIERLSVEAAMGKFSFARAFHRAAGATPHTYLRDLRLDFARRLLATTDLPVTEIATATGFRVSTHFATAFKRRFGVSPRATRCARTWRMKRPKG